MTCIDMLHSETYDVAQAPPGLETIGLPLRVLPPWTIPLPGSPTPSLTEDAASPVAPTEDDEDAASPVAPTEDEASGGLD